MTMKKHKDMPVPPAATTPEPTTLDPLSPEGVAAMKTATVVPLGILLSPMDYDALLGIIRNYAAEIERLRSAK